LFAGGLPPDIQGVQCGRAVDDGGRPAVERVTQQSGEPLGVERRGHGNKRQVSAKLTHLREHTHEKIGLEAPLVDFVDDHCVDAFQAWVIEQPAKENPRSDKLDHRLGTGLVLAPDRVPDPVPEAGSVQGREAARGRTGSHSARLGDEYAWLAGMPLFEEINQQRGHQRGLARTGRGLHDHRTAVALLRQLRREVFDGVGEDQAPADGVQSESHHTIVPVP
jgi:hypothetical protein